MSRLTAILVAALFAASFGVSSQEKVDAKGVSSQIKVDEVAYGHFNEINGKVRLRATELTFEPGGRIGAHHHLGPGIRFVAAGELTFTEGGKATTYKAGEYFYETGNIAHTGENKTKSPVRVIVFEVLPLKVEGPTVFPPRAY